MLRVMLARGAQHRDTMMRVKIGDTLEERIQKVYQQAGYSRPGDLVREATRELVTDFEADHLTQEQSVRDGFTCTVNRGGVGGPVIRLQPKTESPFRFKYFSKGDPPHTTIFDTGTTYIPEHSPTGSDVPGLEDALEQIDGVEQVTVLTKGELSVTVKADRSLPVDDSDVEDTLVDQLYAELERVIDEADQRVRTGDETRQDAHRRAVTDYWEHAHQIGD